MKKEFLLFIESLEKDFFIEDKENFEKEIYLMVDNLKLNGFNDLTDIENKYIEIINKYSTNINEELIRGKINEF